MWPYNYYLKVIVSLIILAFSAADLLQVSGLLGAVRLLNLRDLA